MENQTVEQRAARLRLAKVTTERFKTRVVIDQGRIVLVAVETMSCGFARVTYYASTHPGPLLKASPGSFEVTDHRALPDATTQEILKVNNLISFLCIRLENGECNHV